MKISVTHDLDRLEKEIADIHKRHIPFAAARALTQTAENGRMDTVREIKSRMHMPTNWTLQSMFKKPATKTDLTSMVYLKDSGGNRRYTDSSFPAMGNAFIAAGLDKKGIIGHLFTAGSRSQKGFERALIRARLMDSGMMIVPGAGAPLDANGNIPRGFIVQMLSYFKGLRESKDWMTNAGRGKFGKRQGKKVGIGGAEVEYFISRGKGNWFGRRSWKAGREQQLPPGIWMRAQVWGGRTALKPVIMFIRKKPNYRQLIDLEQIVGTAVRRDFNQQFDIAFADAVRTAR